MKLLTLLILLFTISLNATNNQVAELNIVNECGLYNTDPFTSNDAYYEYRINVKNENILQTSKDPIKLILRGDNNQYTINNESTYPHMVNIDEKSLNLFINSKNLHIINEYQVEVPRKRTDVWYTLIGPEHITKQQRFPAQFNQQNIDIQYNACEQEIHRQKNQKTFLSIMIVVGVIVGFFVVYKLIMTLIRKTKQIVQRTSNRIHEYKVQKIAEDEAIRATVNKAVKENDDELGKLQDLINKAVGRGDTETAKALLEILEKKKSENDISFGMEFLKLQK